MNAELQTREIKKLIYLIRGSEVMLDFDLAKIYEVETKILNQTVRRNPERFPDASFSFQLLEEEYGAISSIIDSAIVVRGKNRKYMPYAFTEHGVAMLSSVLNSPRAIEMHMMIVKAFVEYRKISETITGLTNHVFQMSHRIDRLEQKMDQILSAIRATPNFLETKSLPAPKIPLLGSSSYLEIEKIQNEVARYFGVKLNDFKSSDRAAAKSLPRQIAIYLIRKRLNLPYAAIGKLCGGKDHTTILHAYRKVESAIAKEGPTREAVLLIIKNLNN